MLSSSSKKLYILGSQIECCTINNSKIGSFLPRAVSTTTENIENENFSYDVLTKPVSFKLFETNPYASHLKQVYPLTIYENDLTTEMLNILKTYTGNHYVRTNLNLLTNYDIDWDYINKLRSIIRGLYQHDLRPVCYRGLILSDIEIDYYKKKIGKCCYTNPFSSFTTENNLIFFGNATIILKTKPGNRLNIANVWKWSLYPDEMEAILSISSKVKILTVKK
ncbi:unnamed protein product [Didymodactylos carnosus]|uniref:Uncharacterized protein n=1 Tax=Didymodactylos carnosus TaxID=1234261 RepID=A0A813Q0G1_9BILA|nr:unnamed protein product [Didymodactylos carnosus]CAF1059340.1 unnamed protein product [Didymodactylos carnosus]CAF3537416.1 unnamed protein product [Didymodactylos carnosus]CAF3825094.1 unnamed protein product [Didymodactylos carnosus]